MSKNHEANDIKRIFKENAARARWREKGLGQIAGNGSNVHILRPAYDQDKESGPYDWAESEQSANESEILTEVPASSSIAIAPFNSAEIPTINEPTEVLGLDANTRAAMGVLACLASSPDVLADMTSSSGKTILSKFTLLRT